MRTIKQILIIALVLLAAGHIATNIYLGSSNRNDPPVITCPEGALEVSARDDESVLLTGITASDAQDGDLTDQVIIAGISKLISNDTAKVTYLVFDSNDNMGSCVRYIRYTDYRRPQFDVTEPLVYSTTEDVSVLSRLTATDVVDGDITDRIRVSTLSPTNNSELYNITIQVTNSVGDTAWLQLPVLLLEYNPMRPTVNLSSQLVYLDVGGHFDPKAYLESVDIPGGDASIDDVVIESTVDTNQADTYQVVYSYNYNDNVGRSILTVVVQ